MKRHRLKNQYGTQKGVALLVSVLVTSVVLSIGLAILNVTLKQFILSAIGEESTVAFYAADAGIECGKYWERNPSDGDKFDIGAPDSNEVDCMGANDLWDGGGTANDPQVLDEVTWGAADQQMCTKIEVTKFYDNNDDVLMTDERLCPENFTCTMIESRGYNRACEDIDDPRTVERAIRAFYGGCIIGVNCP